MDDINDNSIDNLNDELENQNQTDLPIQQQQVEEKKEQTKKPQTKLYFIPNKDGTLEQIDFGLLLKKAPKIPKKEPPPPKPVVKEVVRVKTPEKIIPKKEPTPEPEESEVEVSDEVLWGYNKFNLLKHLKKLQKKHNKVQNTEIKDKIQQQKHYIENKNFQQNIQNETRINRFDQQNIISTNQLFNKSNSPLLPKINPKQIAWKPGKAVPMTFQQINKIISLSPINRQQKTPLIRSTSKDRSFDNSKNTIENKLDFLKQKQKSQQSEKTLQFRSAVKKIDYFQKLEFLPTQVQTPPQINLKSDDQHSPSTWKPQQLVNKTFQEIQQQFPLKSPKSLKYKYDRNLQKIENNFQLIQDQF